MKKVGFAGLLAAITLSVASAELRAQLKPDTAGVATQPIEIKATPIAAFAKSGAAFVNSRLEWRGGLALSSSSSLFGGLSGLALSPAGTEFVAVSDSGLWLTGEITYDAKARPKSVASARIGSLETIKGQPLTRQRDRDAEAITLASGKLTKGTACIAFEQNDRIGVFPLTKAGIGKPVSYLAMPAESKRMRMDGIEALAVLAGGPRKGALVAFAENPLRGEKLHRGWVWEKSVPRGFTVGGIEGFSITDAAGLPDGSVLLLERRFRWLEGLRVRLRQLPADSIRPDRTAIGEILLEAGMAQEIDNLEGMAISAAPSGETVVTLVSDDNFNRFFQRTVLLQFTLKDAQTARVQENAAPEDGAEPARDAQ